MDIPLFKYLDSPKEPLSPPSMAQSAPQPFIGLRKGVAKGPTNFLVEENLWTLHTDLP